MKIGEKVVWLDPAHETSHVTEIVQINKPIYVCSNGTTETEALEKELASLNDIMCHKECGNIDIQSEAWNHTNYIEGENPYVEFVDAGRNYCPKCEEVFDNDELVYVESYLKNKGAQ